MSYTSITQSTRDAALRDRITASIAREAHANAEFGDTPTGAQVIQGGPETVVHVFVWPCCIDFEAAYESALAAGNPAPGGDPAVITDSAIGSAVQAHWPAVPPATP